jgi:hypothetical protein
MLALIAAFIFGLAFILALLGTGTGAVSLLFLGLTFLALHHGLGAGVPWRRRG